MSSFTLDQFKEFTEVVLSKLDNIESRLAKLEEDRPEPAKADENFSIKELAVYLKCHIHTVMKKKREGQLPFYQSGRKVFFKRNEIDKIMDAGVLRKGRKW